MADGVTFMFIYRNQERVMPLILIKFSHAFRVWFWLRLQDFF